MRSSRVVTVGIAIAAIFLCWFNTVHAGPSLWPTNRGEFCLMNKGSASCSDPDTCPGRGEVARVSVTHTIGNNYLVQGFVTEKTGIKSLFNGNAIVDGDWVLMHISSSGYLGKDLTGIPFGPHGFVARVELQTSDLIGWVLGVGFNCNGDPAVCNFSYDGVQDLEPTPCP